MLRPFLKNPTPDKPSTRRPVQLGIKKALQTECDELLKRIAECRVGNRPVRLEPRVIKRRRHGYPLMQKPRDVLRDELRKHCT